MSWKNPRWSSITDPDLRAVFQSLEDFTRGPTFEYGIKLGASDGSSAVGAVNPTSGKVEFPPLPEVGNDNLAALLPDGSITTNLLADLAVNDTKLADLAVTLTKLADASVSSTKIADDAVTTPKLVANAVVTSKIATDAVTANEIAAGAVTTTELAAASVVTSKIAADAVTANELAAVALGVGKYIRSTSYVAGSSGWAIDASGTAEFNDVTVRGTLATNTVAGWLTTGTGGGFRTAGSGTRTEISSANANQINFFTGQSGEGFAGQVLSNWDATFFYLQIVPPRLSPNTINPVISVKVPRSGVVSGVETIKLDASGGHVTSDGDLWMNGVVRDTTGRTVIDAGGGWVHSWDDTGWKNDTHGGGWFMNDGTWLRSFNDKNLLTGGLVQADTGFNSGGIEALFPAGASLQSTQLDIKSRGDTQHMIYYDGGNDGARWDTYGGLRLRAAQNGVAEEVGNGSAVVRTVNYAATAYAEHDALTHFNTSDIRFKVPENVQVEKGHHRDLVRGVGRPFLFRWKEGVGGKGVRWGHDATVLPVEFTKVENLADDQQVHLVDPQSMIAALFGALCDVIDDHDALAERVAVLEGGTLGAKK